MGEMSINSLLIFVLFDIIGAVVGYLAVSYLLKHYGS